MKWKLLISLVTGFVIAYLVLSPIALAPFLLFKPFGFDALRYEKRRVAWGIGASDIEIETKSGKKLHGWLFRNPNAKSIALISHGKGGNVTSYVGYASMFLSCGYSALIYDYEGYGKSEGSPSTEAMLHDGEAAIDYVQNELAYKPENIIDCGVSLGTGIAADIAEHHRCAAVVLISPYVSLKTVACETLPYLVAYPNFLYPYPDLGAQSFVAHNATIPILFIHGALDQTIEVHHATDLAGLANCPKQLVIVPDGHHGDLSMNKIGDVLREFLSREKPSVVQRS
jgi:fermentation-respiration switch protein FrsA (DUF1100 family)